MGCCTSAPAPETTAKLPNAKEVAVIGGGIAGLISAYYLAKKGKKVQVFERNGRVGAETSFGPAGVTMWKQVERHVKFFGNVAPTAGGPVGALDFVEGALWQLLDPDPRRPTLMLEARKAHTKFLQEHPDAQPIFHDQGLLYILDEDLFEKNKKKFAGDKSMVFYTKAEFEKSDGYSPMFDGTSYHGILWSKEEGAIDPHRFVTYLAKKVESMGGKVHVNSSVARLEEDAKKTKVMVHVKATDPSDVCAPTAQQFDAAVVTVGVASHPGNLLKESSINDPVDEIYGVKGYSVTGRMPNGWLKMGVVDAVDTKFIRPWLDKEGHFCVRCGGNADAYDKDNPLEIKWDRLDELKDNQFFKKVFEANKAAPKACDSIDGHRFDQMYDSVIEEGKMEVWTGVRPVNKHGRVPIFRWANGSKRVMVVSGFGSNGFVMCWHTGPRVAKLLP